MVVTIKIKGLRPSLREKKRFMLIDTETTKWKITFKETFLRLFGNYGFAQAGIQFLEKNNQQIIRINNRFVDHARATLVLMPSLIRTKRVSGTLKGLGGK